MARTLPFVIALAFVLLLGIAMYRRDWAPAPAPAPAPSASADLDAGSVEPEPEDAATEAIEAESAESSAFKVDGLVPPLPADAPKAVEIGVILFNYSGAQAAPKSAPTKAAAEAKARKALELAKQDFEDAIKLGDPGSTPNAGRIPRGILEPQVEYAVFSLDKGALHGAPLDTPRGFWIVKRLK